ncbi:type I restriction endonuclease subunit R [Streptomyces sp. NBC_00648]|uniref:type I restriction endonuclease subunit R n=1 Tax=Streptomyces sp. NBC_00648 TaxID=2975797 RepID=UPI0032433139
MVWGRVERDEVERPFVEQLKAMGWEHVRGADLADDERASNSEVLLSKRLTAAVRRINRLPGTGVAWMMQGDAERAVDDLRRVARSVAAQSLLRANGDATALLLHGTSMVGPRDLDFLVQYVDWEWEGLGDEEILRRNQFLVVDQFRVRKADGKDAVLDLVLFVNGIPVVVVECKSPERKDAIGDAIRDLRDYAGEPLEEYGTRFAGVTGGVPELFAPAQLLIAASGKTAALGTISSEEEHYAVWRSVEPDYAKESALRADLEAARVLRGDAELTPQHKLIAAVLRPRNLLNIIRHYVFELPVKTKEGEPPVTVKAVCRHQQFRAVEKIVRKLRTGRKRGESGAEDDERGGVIWHTQGSGKSLTMSFLARRLHMSRDPELNRFTLLVVTDRKQLQQQLSAAVRVSGSTIRVAASQTDVEGMLQRAGKPGGRAVIFAMIQKYLGRVPGFVGETAGDDREIVEEFEQARERVAAGEDPEDVADPTPDEATTEAVRRRFTECSTSPSVLVLVDEAHRSHTSVLHACLRDAVPNAARIGFTGTPIMKGKLTDTGRIFGLEPGNTFLDSYRMDEAEKDKVVVPVRYEGRAGNAEIKAKEGMDRKFKDLIATVPEEDQGKTRKATKPTSRDVAESFPIIREKAVDMLAHYVRGPLTGGFKAQVAAVSRRAAVYYRDALRDARAELLARVRGFDPDELRHKKPEEYTQDEILLLRAWQYQEVLRRMDFVPVISEGNERKSGRWREWTDEKSQQEHVERFLEPFPELPPDNPWVGEHPQEVDPLPGGAVGLNPWSNTVGDAPVEKPPIAFLIVKSMLLTGFDAPIEQVLYLDRPIQDAELLQAIARVNRPARLKREGRVVDYYGVLNNLAVTLAAYRGDPPVLDGLRSLSSEVPGMRGAAQQLRRFLKRLGAGGLDGPGRMGRTMLALADPDDRAEYDRLLGEFLDALERVLPHEAALALVPHARRWTELQQRIRRHYRDEPGGSFSMRGYGRKVRALIAEHLELPEITQVIAPVSILDPDFDEIVGRIPDLRESAAEQVQALRYHLQERIEHDDRPVYRELSEDLQQVLDEFAGRWEDIKRELGPLIDRARRAEAADPGLGGLTPIERKLYAKLSDQLTEHPAFPVPDRVFLRALTGDLSSLISDQVSSASWSGQETSLDDLQVRIWDLLRKKGLKPHQGGLRPLTELANSLAGYAQQHAAAFRAERQ